jgi:hypothetical protein
MSVTKIDQYCKGKTGTLACESGKKQAGLPVLPILVTLKSYRSGYFNLLEISLFYLFNSKL